MFFTAHGIGLVPDRLRATVDRRVALSEAIAVQFSMAAQEDNLQMIEATARSLVVRNPDILSLAIRDTEGNMLREVGDHEAHWQDVPEDRSTPTHMRVPIFRAAGKNMNPKRWGTVEISFIAEGHTGLLGLLWSSGVQLALFVALGAFLLYVFYLRRVLRHLDPSAVIPERVKLMLDTLSEGVLVLDRSERIVLANTAFARTVGQSDGALQGERAAGIGWRWDPDDDWHSEFPWTRALLEGQTQKAVPLNLAGASDEEHRFMVNASPILTRERRARGVLVTFDDVTGIEKKNTQLKTMLSKLAESREEVRRQNEELKILATRDPLTRCLNRRAFYERLDAEWSSAVRHGHPLSCIMVDVDRFKNVNDEYGHSIGDQVLQQVSDTLKTTARKEDVICRYGGEEFCILLPHINVDNGQKAAERFREAIASRQASGLSVTASFGVTAMELVGSNYQDLIDAADEALYAAKRTGRNRVVRWDRMPEVKPDADRGASQIPRDEEPIPIPFHAVTGLLSALTHRDPETGQHSRRVADLCVATARSLLTVADCFVLEVAGLLHDIGKIGVPDAILLKPGALTQDEWAVMDRHDRIGVEIINAAFSCPELTNIVRNHHAWFGGSARDPGLPTGQEIPLRARILSIADAFDAMTSDRVYRKRRSREAAFEELRRCAEMQFDPHLVEHFIECVQARDDDRTARPLTFEQEATIHVSIEVERLACALEVQDITTLSAMAERLEAMAHKLNMPQVAQIATELNHAARVDRDLVQILDSTTELLDLCRSAQNEFIEKVHAA